jgi:hypothetical protein
MNNHLSDLFFNFDHSGAMRENDQVSMRDDVERRAAELLEMLAGMNVPNLPTAVELTEDFFRRF